MIFSVLVGVMVAVVAGLVVGVAHAATPMEAAWVAGDPSASAQAQRVCATYVDYVRHWRFAGAMVGIAIAVIVGIGWYGEVRAGIGGLNPLADVFYCGVGGLIAGSLLAEVGWWPRGTGGPAMADLGPQAHPAPTRPDVLRVSRVVAAIGVLLGVVGVLASRGPAGLWVAGLGAVLAGACELAQRTITGRRAVALEGETARIDRRLRGFASARVAWLECAIAFLTLAWVWPLLVMDGTDPADPSPLVTIVSWLMWVGCGIATIVCLVHASPRAPRAVRRGTRPLDPAGALR